jgi:hypothetical protein
VDLWHILTKLQTTLEYQHSQRFLGIETMAALEEIRSDNPQNASNLENEFLVNFSFEFSNYFDFRSSISLRLNIWMIGSNRTPKMFHPS